MIDVIGTPKGVIRIVPGKRIRNWGGWYSHATVTVDGQQIEGTIQTKRRHGRIETITCFKDSCVLGQDLDWLLRMNGR